MSEGRIHNNLSESSAGRMLADGTRSLESNKDPREMGSLRRWWPGGLPWLVGTVDPIVILWSLVLVGSFYFRSKVKLRLYSNGMEILGEAGAWITMK